MPSLDAVPPRPDQSQYPPSDNMNEMAFTAPVPGGKFYSCCVMFGHVCVEIFFDESITAFAKEFPHKYQRLVEDQDQPYPKKDLMPLIYAGPLADVSSDHRNGYDVG